MDCIIKINNLSKEFANKKGWLKHEVLSAVNDVSLAVKEGEIFCLLGANGAGKTTLIKLLCTLILPTKGTAYINGYDIAKDDLIVRQNIGLFTGGERSLYWRLTGRQNLKFFASLCNLSGSVAKKRIKELLQILGIKEPDKRVATYSSGMRQRLAIARSLLHNPAVLFMDEPTKSLDPLVSQEIRVFIKETLVRQQGKTVFFATHNLIEAKFLSDRLAIMETGKIRTVGGWDELQNDNVFK